MSWLRALPLLALGLGVGCMKNTIELETDQGDEDETGDEPTTGDVVTTTIDTGDETGTPGGPELLLLALNTPLVQGLPFQGIVNLTPGAGTVDLTLQWLTLDIASTTTPRQPVGDVYAYTALPVDGSGTFYWDTGIILIPAAANPITGEDLVVSIQANVSPSPTPAYCGVAGGTITSPMQISLEGTTHAMTEVPSVSNLPATFAMACP